jgi:hypothetical protein
MVAWRSPWVDPAAIFQRRGLPKAQRPTWRRHPENVAIQSQPGLLLRGHSRNYYTEQ